MPDRAAQPGGPATEEIEITPEMIGAGIAAYYLFDPGSPTEAIVWSIFVEMEKARLRQDRESCDISALPDEHNQVERRGMAGS